MIKFKELRVEQGMSQAALARLADLNPSTVCGFESGRLRPYPSQAQKVANALNWDGDPDDLFKDVSANAIS